MRVRSHVLERMSCATTSGERARARARARQLGRCARNPGAHAAMGALPPSADARSSTSSWFLCVCQCVWFSVVRRLCSAAPCARFICRANSVGPNGGGGSATRALPPPRVRSEAAR